MGTSYRGCEGHLEGVEGDVEVHDVTHHPRVCESLEGLLEPLTEKRHLVDQIMGKGRDKLGEWDEMHA